MFDMRSCVHPAALSGFGLAYLSASQAKPDLESGALVEVLTNWRQTFEGYHLYFLITAIPPPHSRYLRALEEGGQKITERIYARAGHNSLATKPAANVRLDTVDGTLITPGCAPAAIAARLAVSASTCPRCVSHTHRTSVRRQGLARRPSPPPRGAAAERHSLAMAYSLRAHHKTLSHRAARQKDEPLNHGLVHSPSLPARSSSTLADRPEMHAPGTYMQRTRGRLALYVTAHASYDSDDPPVRDGI